MQIAVIGSGNVARMLARRFLLAGHEVLQVYSRQEQNAKILGDELRTEYTSEIKKINPSADCYLIAVSDSVVVEIASWLRTGSSLVIHTAGSVSKNVLEPVSKNFGVLYPLQSITRKTPDSNRIPFLVDGNTADSLTLIYELASSLSQIVRKAGDDERLKLHTAAVVVSNFTNHLYVLAEEFCSKENLDFTLLKPLISEVANRLDKYNAYDVQTGPATRNDLVTINKHLDLLSGYPRLRKFYEIFTESIRNTKV